MGSYQITTDGRYVYRLNTATGDIDLFERGYRPMIKELPQAGSSKRYDYDAKTESAKTSAAKTE